MEYMTHNIDLLQVRKITENIDLLKVSKTTYDIDLLKVSKNHLYMSSSHLRSNYSIVLIHKKHFF